MVAVVRLSIRKLKADLRQPPLASDETGVVHDNVVELRITAGESSPLLNTQYTC